MNWYDFIFSDTKWQRQSRHLLFWLLWWVYFSLSYFHYSQTGLDRLVIEPWNLPFFIKTILLLSLHILACYFFINFLIPNYVLKARYSGLAYHIFNLSLLLLFSSYFLHKEVFPEINSNFNYIPKTPNDHIWWTSITAGLLSAPKIITAAAAWKLIKRWWLKQKEKERLLQEKMITDLQILKVQIHPKFLFSSLDNISLWAERKDNEKASMVLLKLADILSYMLYDCDNNLVLLEKEIKIIKDFLAIQKIRMGDRLEIDIAVKGEIANNKITPQLLFSFIENSFTYIIEQEPENCWINLEFQIERSVCTMKLIHGKSDDAEILTLNRNIIASMIKKLDFFYPENYELKTTVEPDILMTSLKIVLEEPVDESNNNFYHPETVDYATV